MFRWPSPCYRFLSGPAWKARVLAPEIARSAAISRALSIVRSRWPGDTIDDDISPIFLLSAGWGSGSTLLQRLIMSGKDALLWGEPFDHAVPIFRLAETIAPISDRWPRDRYFGDLQSSVPLHDQWIANLVPPVRVLRRAHREFLDTWLGSAARDAGFRRWGLKEVRLTADHARFLKWLFPKAKFVFLYRDVVHSWASCRHVRWFSVWPGYKVARPSAFAHHWRHLVEGFLHSAKSLDALVVRYEDLKDNALSLESLAAHLEIEAPDPSVLELRLGARSGRRPPATPHETAIIRSITDELRAKLGYC